ncbi:myocilin [Bufo gargarizans]|uniref:myocilin n=1 Tax=Bufo gargarizans TaxID=30331 RepID=UPI001CF5635D|nr:myocilin [Bufo gargarizans]
MGLLTLPVFISVMLCVAQGSPQLRRANDRQGQCTYTFTVPSPREGTCTEPGEAMTAIWELQRENSAVKQDADALKIRLSLLEKVINRLLGGEGIGQSTSAPHSFTDAQIELQRLKLEKDEWESQRGSLEMAYSDLLKEKSSLEEEKQRLTERLEKVQQRQCPQVVETSRNRDQPVPSKQEPSATGSRGVAARTSSVQSRGGPSELSRWGADGVGYQELKSELTALPASRMLPEIHSASQGPEDTGTDGCGELTWLGEPTTYRKADNIAGKYGVWMKDPEPPSPFTLDTIWRINTVGADIRQVFEYETLDGLVKGYPTKVYVVPRSMESNGAVVYKGSLYYVRRKSRILVKYDFKTETLAIQKELVNAGYHGKFPYSWGGYTDIDLAVDEMGLWAIYSTENTKGSIVISQLDPKTLEAKQSWNTTIRKQSVANAFMVCGTLYTVGSYASPTTTINFAFDTHTGVQKQTSIPFQNLYGYTSMVDYNPTEKKIYGWDNYNMVAYDVRLSKM